MISEKKLEKFKKWLHCNGAEILQPTNDYEVLRFRCIFGVGVIYKGKKGINVSTSFVVEAYECYINGRKWNGGQRTPKRSNGYKKQLFIRDGSGCWYCGKNFSYTSLTVEHILSLVHKGPNRIENKVLACRPCNEEAGNKSIVEKVRLRDLKRGYIKTEGEK